MSFWDMFKKAAIAIQEDTTNNNNLIDAWDKMRIAHANNQPQTVLASAQLSAAQSLLQNQLGKQHALLQSWPNLGGNYPTYQQKTLFEQFKEVHETNDLGFEIKTALIYSTDNIPEFEDALCFLKRDCEGKRSFAWYNPFNLSIQMTFELESDLVMFKLKFANEANRIKTLDEENQQ